MPVSDQACSAAEKAFAPDDLAEAISLLGTYRDNETERVQLAVIALSTNGLDDLRHYAAAAARDYRDVLFWAEYPEDSKGPRREAMRRRYESLGVPVPPALSIDS
jgi:hypothetical protein